MFKKKFVTKNFKRFKTMKEKEIIMGVQAIQRRSLKPRYDATFMNAHISKKTCRQLRRKGYKVEVSNCDGIPEFKVSW